VFSDLSLDLRCLSEILFLLLGKFNDQLTLESLVGLLLHLILERRNFVEEMLVFTLSNVDHLLFLEKFLCAGFDFVSLVLNLFEFLFLVSLLLLNMSFPLEESVSLIVELDDLSVHIKGYILDALQELFLIFELL